MNIEVKQFDKLTMTDSDGNETDLTPHVVGSIYLDANATPQDDLRVTVDGVEQPRWVSTSDAYPPITKVTLQLIFRKRRKLTPLSRAQVQAALKRIPETVVFGAKQ